MSIDIVITTHHSPTKLKRCLSAILAHTVDVDYRILLWCNEANEEVKKVISSFVSSCNISAIYNDSNQGSFAYNNNCAAKTGNGDCILFLNDDCYPTNDNWLHDMVKILDTDDKVGVVGALLLYPNNTIQHCGVFFSSKTNNLPYHMNYRLPISKLKAYVNVPRYYQAVTGACMLLRRADFEAIGGFCEDFYYMYEDIALCLDIKSIQGKNCVYCPDAILIHDEGISKDGKYNPHFTKNVTLFVKKYSTKHYNDLEFYLGNPKHLIYKYK